MDKFDNQNTARVAAIDLEPEQIDNPEFSTGDLGKIQEILFGQQLRANTAQFSNLNHHIEERLTRLSDTCQQQFTELSDRVDSSIVALKTAQDERDKEVQSKLAAITHGQTSLETSFTAKLRANSDSSTQIQQQLNGQIEKSNSALTESLDSTRTELTKMLETAIADLQSQKLDRAALSSLLGTVANQLTNEHQPTNGLSGNNSQAPHNIRTKSVDRK